VSEVGFAVECVMRLWRSTPARHAALAAITGIDACGKGILSARVASGLEDRRLLASNGWLRLPTERFDRARPAAHFYECALRLGEMFERLVLPLRDRRTYAVDADLAEETATAYHPSFLLFRRFRRHHPGGHIPAEGDVSWRIRYFVLGGLHICHCAGQLGWKALAEDERVETRPVDDLL